MEKAESQGHRLSSYASSSSNKHSPKTPKKSTDKLSTHSTSKEESLSPHHLVSGYSYNSINSQSKELHPDCLLKCTCNNNSSYSSLKSIKSNGGEKQIKLSKMSCDAATSPSRFNQKSPQPNYRLINNKTTSTSTCNELRISDEKKVLNKSSPSPRRLVSTRNAATSPNLDVRKHINRELFPKSPELLTKTQLEKSNSLGESRPTRPLRTTRSLSPRPPVRHQHAIMVSDENDIVSVKISPNEDFEGDLNKLSPENSNNKRKHKAQSEQTSPNLSEYNVSFTYEKKTNKSTGCLVYVPSDPWLKMSDIHENKKKLNNDTKKHKNSKISQESRSLSRGNLEPLNTDPWIWRQQNDGTSPSHALIKKSPKQEIYRQAKSFSATKFELLDSSTGLTISKTDSSAKSNIRPKLQRCKSPLIIDDEIPAFITNEKQLTCTCSAINDKKATLPIPLTSSTRIEDKKPDTTTVQPNKSLLNVINPNLIQSRHSFSSVSQKDDELQLNIRRLSEQIKNNNGTPSSGPDFTDYVNQFRCSDTQKVKSPRNSAKSSDSVLETTC